VYPLGRPRAHGPVDPLASAEPDPDPVEPDVVLGSLWDAVPTGGLPPLVVEVFEAVDAVATELEDGEAAEAAEAEFVDDDVGGEPEPEVKDEAEGEVALADRAPNAVAARAASPGPTCR